MNCIAVFAAVVASLFSAPDPQVVFDRPPQSAKTGVWWHWMGCSVTKEGIVKDLDWFDGMGIGAATIFGMADICTPWATRIGDSPGEGLVAFTPEWWSLVRFACEEAEKRGIEIGVHNCPGYTSTGGPWIPPRLAMRELVFNVTNAEAQISLEANAAFPLQDGNTGKFCKPEIPCRRTDIQEIAVVDGIRVQHIPMGAFTQPNQWETFGLECDKMNPEAVNLHLDRVIGDMRKHLGDQIGRGLKFVLLDSYEAGNPTWTPNMREEFKARRGYDPLPFLPILGGFKVSAAPDAAAEKKFKDDYDRTIKDLYRDVLFKTMREKLSAAGLEFACEPYRGPFDSRECAMHVDRLMTEFWFNPREMDKFTAPEPLGWNEWTGPGGTRHNVVEAEAFTGRPEDCQWTETPSMLKAVADFQFCRGINRMTLHTCPLQPWGDDVKPGRTMGRWGTHFGRTQTWANSGRSFFSYLNRCQALLQWGRSGKTRLDVSSASPDGKKVASLCRESGGRYVFFVANLSGSHVSVEIGNPAPGKTPEWFDPVSGRIAPLAVAGGKSPVSLPPHGSGFFVLRRDVPSASANPPAEGHDAILQPIGTVWRVSFDGFEVDMPVLKNWTSFGDPQVKYFSGTAKYRTSFEVKASNMAPGRDLMVSLGDCNGQIAKVILNGRDLGTLWCEPYAACVPAGVFHEGANVLEIEFTNVWANRLIGDEQEPPDCDFSDAPLPGGWYLKRFPSWFSSGIGSRPSKGRKCFTDWKYFTKDSKLVSSGLLGPVRISACPVQNAVMCPCHTPGRQGDAEKGRR